VHELVIIETGRKGAVASFGEQEGFYCPVFYVEKQRTSGRWRPVPANN